MSTIPGLVAIEFTEDTTDKAGNPKRSKGDRLLVDKKQAEVFAKRGVAKLVVETKPRHSVPVGEAKPDAPAAGAS